ncbi:MAG TPA: response regulator [Byssovorax sp.]
MPSTLLAVDDSVTMRKVLEITFAGPDFKVVAVPSADAALQKLKSDKPDLVICDLTLDPKNGYDVCKAIKQASPQTPVLLLSSKQNAFVPALGTDAQADDHIDKPFDTQQMIDKVKKLLAAPAGARPAAAAPAAAAAAPAARPAAPAAAASRAPVAPAAASAVPAMPSPTMQRAKTLIYNPPPGVQSGAPVAPAAKPLGTTTPLSPTPVTGLPMQAPAAAATHAPAPAPAAAAAHVNGQMAGKLEQLGLSPAQVDAVLAISRDVVERVVWEVVPVLAETIIKEELARLTK